MLRTLATTLPLLVPATLLGLGVGCASDMADLLDGDTAAWEDDTGQYDTASLDDTGSDTPQYTYFSVSGSLTLEAGEPQPGSDTLTLAFLTDSLDEEDHCEGSADITALAAAPQPGEDLPLYAWWEVSLDAAFDSTCAVTYPAPLYLGVGALDPLLYPAMDANELDPTETSVYGLYTLYGPDDPPLFVFGLAGTSENWAGMVDPVASAPLPDGTYTLQTLYLLPLLEASR